MEQNSRKYIEQIVDRIEDSLRDPASLDDIAASLYLSKYHLVRLFKAVTGQSVMSYVRNRRLSVSLSDLLQPDLRIIDIAQNYYFSYEQSYSRAFRRLFGISPGEYRKEPRELPVLPKFDVGTLLFLPQGILLEPRYCRLPAFRVVGLESLIRHDENWRTKSANALGLRFYKEYFRKVSDSFSSGIYVGLVTYGENRAIANLYLAGIESRASEEVLPPLISRDIPDNSYAVFRYVGFHGPTELSIRNLGEIYDLIDNVWYKTTRLTQSAPYHFERMELAKCSSTYCEAEIYIPVMMT